MGFARESPRYLAVAAVAALTAWGASYLFAAKGSAVGQPAAGETLTFGLSTDTATIDPSLTGSAITGLITRNVVDSLVGQAEDNRFTPWLAERWEVSPDHTR